MRGAIDGGSTPEVPASLELVLPTLAQRVQPFSQLGEFAFWEAGGATLAHPDSQRRNDVAVNGAPSRKERRGAPSPEAEAIPDE